MKTAIVTGAGGFIGGALTKNLLEKNVTVYGIDISVDAMQRHKAENFIPVAADFSMYENLSALLPKNADVFYHFAWKGGLGREAFQNYALQFENAKAACDAIGAAIQSGCKKFVFAGTVNEYEMNKYIHMDTFAPRYAYIYSAAKQASEAVCKTLAFNRKIEFCAGRIAMVFGENNRHTSTLPNVIMKNLLTNVPCRLIEGSNPYDMVYIDDIAEAFFSIGEKGRHMKSYYIGHTSIPTFREIMTEIAEILNPSCPLLFGEYSDSPSGIEYDKIDLDALYRDTGFECRADFRESILKTAAWLRAVLDINPKDTPPGRF